MRLSKVALLAALALAIGAAPAGASVTLGQVGTAGGACVGPLDLAQTGVTSGAPYVVPEAGTITSWSHLAISGGGQSLTFKVFRFVTDPNVYRVCRP